MRILVVDDEPSVAGLIAEGLRNEGYGDVVIATSGEQGLQVLEWDPPDVVFLDIILPDGSAVSLIAELNARAREEAIDRPPPAIVRAYRSVYGLDPRGWPPA
jgi:DNA-binding response OmpR family regulator